MIKKLYFKMKKERLLAKAVLLSAVAFFAITGAHAQSAQVSGKVTDSRGGGLPGVTVVVKGNSTIGTTTSATGDYTISVPSPQSELVFSFIGYASQTQTVGNRRMVDITLEEDVTGIDEIIVLGFGSQKKEFLVGSVSQVSAKELITAPMNNTSQLLTGKVAGISSIQRSGTPGNDNATIAVRGYNTFGEASPLFLVDGVERMPNTINPNDIENISILKDAATAAVYGLKAASGVVLITTKQGREGESRISYSTSATFTKNTAFPKFLDGPDYLYWYNQASILDGNGPVYDATIQDKVLNGDPDGLYGNTNWMKEIYNNYGFTHQHNVSASGGNNKIKHFTSVGLLDQDGIVKNTSYKRFNVRSNIESKIAKNLTFNLNLAGNFENRNWPGYPIANQADQSPFQQALTAAPIINVRDNEGNYLGWSKDGSYIRNAVAAIEESGYAKMKRWQFYSTADLTYDFQSIPALKGLKAKVNINYDYGNMINRELNLSYKLNTFNMGTMGWSEANATGITSLGSFTKAASYGYTLTVRPTLEYQREFGKHSVSGLFLYEQSQLYDDTMTGRKYGYTYKYPADISLGTEWPADFSLAAPVSGNFDHKATRSYVGRFNYMYDSRYIMEFSFRADGSYIFDKDNRWGFFPSVSAGWIVSNENFFDVEKIKHLKVRGSFGELGDNDVDPYLYMRTYKLAASNYVFGGSLNSGYYTNNSATSILTWSRTRSYNIGFDLVAWNGLLGVEFDWFYQYTFDILEAQSAAYPPSLGGNYTSYGNTGRVDNRGFEIVLKHTNNVNKDWRYSLQGNLSWARNKVLSRIESESVRESRSQLGRSMGLLYGLEAIGLFQTQEQIDNAPAPPSGYIRLGDIMYRDVNGDGKINNDDFVRIGYSTTPEMNFSLNMNVSWKNLYMNMLWQGAAMVSYQLSGVYGAYYGNVPDNTQFTMAFYGGGNAPYYLVEDAWRPDNMNAKYPRLSTEHNGNNAWNSSFWTKNGNYLRLKNLQIGYSIPQSFLRGVGIQNLDIYFAGTNLATFSGFKYVDPEMPSVSNGYYPQQKTYSIGLNITF